MSKTNFDDIDLTTPGIEADEINTESATAGQVLTADGVGGAAFQDIGIEAGEVNSESATLGQVLTADGAGGAAFQDGVREGGWTAISFAPGWGNWDTPTNQFAYKRLGALIFLHGVVVRNSGTALSGAAHGANC